MKRINNIMQAVFYKLAAVLPENESIELHKNDIEKSFKSKGKGIVEMNLKAVDATLKNLIKIEYNQEEWLKAEESEITKNYN